MSFGRTRSEGFSRNPTTLVVFTLVVGAFLGTATRARAQITDSLVVASSMRPMQDVDLGGGIQVRRQAFTTLCHQRGGRVYRCSCVGWVPVGFSFGDHGELASADYFARAGTGRIVAFSRVGTYDDREPFIAYSDDLGATWREVLWESPALAIGMMFDSRPHSTFGVALGGSGQVWTTDDGGQSWTEQRNAMATRYTRAVIVGPALVLVDTDGVISISRDAGFSLETITVDAGAVLAREGASLFVTTSDHRFRVTAHGEVWQVY